MEKDNLASQVENLIETYLINQGFELIEFSCRQQGGDLMVRILADRLEGGISINECSRINREVGAMLDEKNVIEQHYILEVFSPGLDRPLATQKDFLRNLNKPARFFLNDLVEGKIELEGIIRNADAENVYIDKDKKTITIPLSKINKAKQIIN